MSSFRLALRNLTRRGPRTFATGFAVFFGVVALVFADAWVRGIGQAIRDYAVEGRLGALQIHPAGSLSFKDAYPLDQRVPSEGPWVEALQRVPEVAGVAPRIRFAGTISNGRDDTMFFGTGFDVAREARVCPRFLAGDLVSGRPLRPDDHAALIVGSGLAQALGLGPGSNVTLQARTPDGRLNAIDAEVVGIATSNLPDEARWMVLVPLGAAQELLRIPGEATALAVGVTDLDRLDEVTARLAPLLAAKGFEASPWRKVGLYFDQAIRTFGAAQGFLLGVLALLVGLVVGNTQALAAWERTREIGTWLCLGARRAHVRRLFLIEAVLLGGFAGLAGAGAGLGISFAAARAGIPFKPPNQPRVLVRPAASPRGALAYAVGAAAVALAASCGPAWGAARKRPIEALNAL